MKATSVPPFPFTRNPGRSSIGIFLQRRWDRWCSLTPNIHFVQWSFFYYAHYNNECLGSRPPLSQKNACIFRRILTVSFVATFRKKRRFRVAPFLKRCHLSCLTQIPTWDQIKSWCACQRFFILLNLLNPEFGQIDK